MRVLAATLLICVTAAAACGGKPTDPTEARIGWTSLDVQAAREAGGVRLTNSTAQPVAYAVWNRGWLALFAPCTTSGPDCPRLAPGASIIIPDEEIDGWAPGAPEAIVRWWHVLSDGSGGLRAGEVHEIIVVL